MDEDRRRRIESLFLEALERSAPEREAFLREACADDEALRREVSARLLERSDRDSVFFDPPVDEAATLGDAAPGPGNDAGSFIGAYQVTAKLGEGAFGVVYAAVQRTPVRREVAVKVIKPGMDSREVLARFEAERQALAVMEHPGIAMVHDAGRTERGRPYFVMELVRGEPITAFCDRHRLTVEERVRLFIQVCDAVQHAHQKGVIHRDLKPSNVLVHYSEGESRPKVIDFGVAKALNTRLTEETIFTERGQMIGTPEYMSPEQAEHAALGIDTRTDVYSLGAMLYELLSGMRPFELREAALLEMQRIIRETEPARPSTRLSTLAERDGTGDAARIARARKAEMRSLSRGLRGDLDWIVMKCLDKERSRRYDSASAVGTDLERYLADEPVEAGPPSVAYRLGKFARRHRAGVIAAASIAAALVIGVVGMGIFAAQAAAARAEALESLRLAEEREAQAEAAREAEAQERARAESNARTAGAVGEFLIDALSSVRPEEARGREVTVRELLDRASAEVETVAPENASIEAALRQAIGSTYYSLGEFDEAEPKLLEAIEMLEGATDDADQRTVAAAKNTLGLIRLDEGRLDEARTLFEEAASITTSVLGERHEEALALRNNLAWQAFVSGRYPEAVERYSVLLPELESVHGSRDRETLRARIAFGGALNAVGRRDEAAVLLEEGLAACRETLPPEDPLLAQALHSAGWLRIAQGDPQAGAAMYREALSIRRSAAGDRHQMTLTVMSHLAWVLTELGEQEEALSLAREAYEGSTEAFGRESRIALEAMNSYAIALTAHGELERAIAIHRQRHDAASRIFGPDNPNALDALNNLGVAIWGNDQPDEAAAIFEQVVAGRISAFDEQHPSVTSARNNLALALNASGRSAEAAEIMRSLTAYYNRMHGPENLVTLNQRANLAVALLMSGEAEEALAIYEEVAPPIIEQAGEQAFSARAAMSGHMRALLETGDSAAAIRQGERLLRVTRAVEGCESAGVGVILRELGRAFLAAGDLDRAKAELLESWRLLRANEAYAESLAMTAESLAEVYERLHEAEPDGGHEAEAALWAERAAALEADSEDG